MSISHGKFRKVIALLLAFALFSGQIFAALSTTNGDFSDTSGMTDIGGGWYSGTTPNWSGTGVTDYSIHD